MLRQKRSLVEIGGGLVLLGLGVKLAALLSGLANVAIVAGIVLLVIGLASPGRR